MTTDRPSIDRNIAAATRALLDCQRPDGHWAFELEADATIPAEYVLLRHYLAEPVNAESTFVATARLATLITAITAAFIAPAEVPEMPSKLSQGSSSRRSSTPQVNAPWAPPPCSARSTRTGLRSGPPFAVSGSCYIATS